MHWLRNVSIFIFARNVFFLFWLDESGNDPPYCHGLTESLATEPANWFSRYLDLQRSKHVIFLFLNGGIYRPHHVGLWEKLTCLWGLQLQSQQFVGVGTSGRTDCLSHAPGHSLSQSHSLTHSLSRRRPHQSHVFPLMRRHRLPTSADAWAPGGEKRRYLEISDDICRPPGDIVWCLEISGDMWRCVPDTHTKITRSSVAMSGCSLGNVMKKCRISGYGGSAMCRGTNLIFLISDIDVVLRGSHTGYCSNGYKVGYKVGVNSRTT